MRPLKLEFEGINSFSEHTIIDFERLIKSGIFGIFGDTGSGKSTILDCINFALYGKVERSKEKTDIINYRCNSATVKFTFDLINRGQRRIYFIERTIKNNKSGTHSAVLYEDGVCIAQQAQDVEKQIIDILGVKAEDFRKCIALPQGEFSRFVKSLPSERLALIERLFSLSKYGNDLRDKISERIKDADEEYATLTGKLSAYEEVSDDSPKILCGLIEQDNARLVRLSEELSKATAAYENLKNIHSKKEEADLLKIKIEKLNLKKPSVDELRQEISILPLCREAVAYAQAAEGAEREADQIKLQLSRLKERLTANETNLAKLESELKEGDFERGIELYTNLTAKYQTCAGKPEKLATLDRELDDKRAQYKRAEKISSDIEREIKGYKSEVASLEKLIGSSKSSELEEFVNVEFKGAILRGEYVASLEYFSDLGTRLEPYDDGSELYAFIKDELKKQINLYKERISYVKDFKLENVNKQFEALQNEIKKREENSELLRNLSKKLSDAEGRAEVNSHNIENLKKDGVEIRKRADELKAELTAVFGEDCTDYGLAEKNAQYRLESLKAARKELLGKIENCKTLRGEINVSESKLNETARYLEEKIKENHAKTAEIVKKSGFKDISACFLLAEKFANVKDAEQEVKEFDASYAAAVSRYSELTSKEGLEKAASEALAKAEQIKNSLEEQKSALMKELAVAEEKLKTVRIKLEEKNELLKRQRRAEKTRNLIYQLRDITKGNKFLEFIADEYLYDISAMASVTLLKLTDGRYFLTYKDSNFNVGDNFDCGNLRGVNTLSGGETFLVSLSLALALSQTICSRSLKSIEFFFLDEGFGTLDGNLLDTVMSALEKLKSSSFTIGIISHVEELKHRIDNKIIVQKATESHGSTVQMCC